MIGHTDKATINARRPLTENMLFVLRWASKSYVRQNDMSAKHKNAMRGLMDRGYVVPNHDGPTQTWHITEAGKAAL